MNATATEVGTASSYLDAICHQIQLSESQYAMVEKRYEEVGTWLREEDKPNDLLVPYVFSQGSMKLRTTVRPHSDGQETVHFDLDAVCRCQVDPTTVSSQSLYDRVKKRLEKNPHYVERLTGESKCIRLDYDNDDFHLDVIPACKDRSDPEGIRLLIPDRSRWSATARPIATWRSTDPVRYALAFGQRSIVKAAMSESKNYSASEPLPEQEPVMAKAPLRRVTQLLKHSRNLHFVGDECVPSSILITTLAATFYQGEGDTADAMDTILDGIVERMKATAPKRMVVLNLVEPTEDLAAGLNDAAYSKFCKMILKLQADMAVLRNPKKPTDLGESLKALAGKRLAAKASAEVQEEVRQANVAGSIGVSRKALTLHVISPAVVVPSIRPVRTHNLHYNG